MTGTERGGLSGDGWIDAGQLLGESVRLVFTDRSGGCSPPPFDTLNLAFHTGDDPRNVHKNREILAEAMGVDPWNFIYLNQVHGIKIARADKWDLGDIHDIPMETFPATDGSFTTEKTMVLSVLTADCLPLAMADTENGVVSMLHAGWRGTVMDIVGMAVSRLAGELRIKPDKIRTVMGPGIGPCCYRVDEGRARAYVEKYGRTSGVIREENGFHLDLYQANRINMLRAGIKEDNISVVGGCTCCDRRYFSFRRDVVTGRQGAFVYLRR